MSWSQLKTRVWHVGTLQYTISGLVTLFFLLLMGDFAWSMKERSVFQIVQLLFKEYGASDTVNSILIMSLPAGLGIFLGPIFGYRSDRCRSRWGRRIPYLLITTPIAAGAMFGLAASPSAGRLLAEVTGWDAKTLTLIILGINWTLFEIATVIAGALFGALVNDVVPEEFLGRFYGLFRAISLLAGILFNALLLGYASTHYHLLFCGIGLLYAAGFAVMCFKVKEGSYPPVPEEKKYSVTATVKNYFRDSYAHPYYLFFFLFSAMANTAMAPLSCFSLFYARSLDVSMDHFGKAIAITYTISLVLAWPLGYLADKLHPLRVAIFMLAAYALSSFCAFATVDSGVKFLVFFVINIAFAGIYATGSASMMQRLLPKEKFAAMCAAGTVLCSLLYMLLVPAVGMFLDWTKHQYRYTFLLGGVFCTISCIVGLFFYRQFKKHFKNGKYQAPEV